MDCSTPGIPVLHHLPEFAPCPLSWWCHSTISSSVVPFSSCLQFFPASGSFPMSGLFTSGGQSIGASASASVLPMNIQITWENQETAPVRDNKHLHQDGSWWDGEEGHLRWQNLVTGWFYGVRSREGHGWSPVSRCGWLDGLPDIAEAGSEKHEGGGWGNWCRARRQLNEVTEPCCYDSWSLNLTKDLLMNLQFVHKERNICCL